MADQDSSKRPLVYLATCPDWPEGEPGSPALNAVLAKNGIEFKWISWDDPDVDWSQAHLVAVRSTWDYQDRLADFLPWAERVGSKLLHGIRHFRWNTDKRYLLDFLAAGVPTVPTEYASSVEAVRKLVSREGKHVVKPAIGAGGFGVQMVQDAPSDWTPSSLAPWVVQPFVESVRTEGETAVFLIDGAITVQIQKTVAGGEFRINEDFGGQQKVVPVSDEAAALAKQALAAAETALQAKILYARLDLLRYQGQLVISEMEITEPGLYLDVVPEHAEPFVNMLKRILASQS